MPEASEFFHAFARAIGCLVHVTPSQNLPVIMADGLEPRKPQDAEDIEGVYLFPGKEDAENALDNWLGERFDDDVELSMLYVHPGGLTRLAPPEVEWEIVSTAPIDPAFIVRADPVLRDDAGSVVPLSRRFDPPCPDARGRATGAIFPGARSAGAPPAAPSRAPVADR